MLSTMSDSSAYWSVECSPGEPDLFVCMDCLDEVFRAKVPIQGCPGCGAVSTFEAFALNSLVEWGTPELIAKAQATGVQLHATPVSADSTALTDGPLTT
ncbi:MAG: hypothetical protein NPIRA04_29140 [Nitrospirales bacterium]|nr:MAG: hypothetical protein NPIRA04_29140 [Nitrospirales bacterium]